MLSNLSGASIGPGLSQLQLEITGTHGDTIGGLNSL